MQTLRVHLIQEVMTLSFDKKVNPGTTDKDELELHLQVAMILVLVPYPETPPQMQCNLGFPEWYVRVMVELFLSRGSPVGS
jgi:hypothetical protein